MVEMKDSGISWVGMIPKHWKINKGKYFINYIERAVRDDDEVVTCFRDGEVTLRTNRREDGFTVSEKEIGYQGINEGDLIVHGMDGFAGAIGISDSKGKASPVLNVLDPNGDKRFYMYYLRNMAYGNVFLALSTGIRVRTCDTNWKKLRELPYLVPPVEEQIRIADYIEKKCLEIDALHSDIEKQIEILEEYKKSIITEAVTKGLNPDVEMKDSGIEWIGHIQKDIVVVPLKYLLETSKSSVKVGPFGSQLSGSDFVNEETEYWVYNQRSVIDKNSTSGTAFISKEKYENMQGFYVDKGDVLITTRGTIGKIFRIPESFNKGIIHPCIIKFRINEEKIMYELLELIFNESDLIEKQINYKSNATTIEVIYSETLKNLFIPVPPFERQQDILNYLLPKCTEVDGAIEDKKKQLETLEEYKKSLIYEYVTGKREVPDNE